MLTQGMNPSGQFCPPFGGALLALFRAALGTRSVGDGRVDANEHFGTGHLLRSHCSPPLKCWKRGIFMPPTSTSSCHSDKSRIHVFPVRAHR